MRFCFNPLVLFLLSAFALTAHAGDDVTALKLDPALTSEPGNVDELPVFMSAQRLEGKKDNQIEAFGAAELRRRGQSVSADYLLYLQDSGEVIADGAVRVEQNGNVMQGPHLKLELGTNIGYMSQPSFHFADNNARGNADTLHLQGRQDYLLDNVTYTTCPADDNDWLLKVGGLEIDQNRQVGVAHSALVEFMGVPILYTPWMDFGLTNQRKSGFLGPVFGSTVQGGNEVTLPYYWNIAPNLDAMFSPRVIAKRGIMLNNEFRYLEPTYSGEAHVDVLPDDRVANLTRSRLSLLHVQNFGDGLSGSVNFNRVSDDAYFRDLSDAISGISATSQINLLREGVLSYGSGWWSAMARVQRYQTLQDPAAPVVEPYRRLPQFSVAGQRSLDGAEVSFAGDYVDYRHPTLLSGQRLVLYPSVSYPLLADPSVYLTPKIGLHNTYYVMGANNTESLPDASRTLPIFSLDSGMTLERDWNMGGQDFVQTLEPRAFYVYIPYRDQNSLPNFDSGQGDFTFAQMFTENRLIGSDRIGDANNVTLALTSRLLAPDSGVERLRLAVGQRFSFQTPRVNLVAPTATTNKSDILFEAAGPLTRAWSLNGSLQYNPSQSQSENFSVTARYQPEAGKVLNLGYRFTRDTLRQVDLSTQWPLSGHWHGMANWNYSLQDRQIVEALAGLEYNQSCWTARLVAQRFATATQQVSTGIFVQLELNDLVKIGSDPLSVLRQSIPGYTKLNDSLSDGPVQGLR
jgi:LPS-assembly protein